ncbi:citryl-CoA lyase [Alteribacillus bidgolensis]|uniref:citrate synthase (unknown stereospecificity) n=1 Tax=Alteribacillus bidgolensis TaxID=930129 RepID=A0A1G8GZA7_9BACI|nr:citryl-CoA lyase [Alteribacillus bidgolensis]SDH99732.1 citrate synthase [Alteribacillus bidgolensis]
MSGRSALESYQKGEGWWQTEISQIKKNEVNIRGYKMEDLIGNISYGQMLYLLLCGDILDEKKAKLFESVLVAGADHGPRAPSIAAGRMAATCGISFNSAVATGINLLGDSHGGATEKGMKLLYETWEEARESGKDLYQVIDSKLDDMLSKKEKLPGIGHQLHDDDPRVNRLYELAEPMAAEKEISGVYLDIAEQYRRLLAEKKKRSITMNIDGVAAAIQCEIGLPAEAAKGIFALSRGMGIAAHAFEEMQTGVLVKGPCPNDEELVKYTGVENRKLSGGEEVR